MKVSYAIEEIQKIIKTNEDQINQSRFNINRYNLDLEDLDLKMSQNETRQREIMVYLNVNNKEMRKLSGEMVTPGATMNIEKLDNMFNQIGMRFSQAYFEGLSRSPKKAKKPRRFSSKKSPTKVNLKLQLEVLKIEEKAKVETCPTNEDSKLSDKESCAHPKPSK